MQIERQRQSEKVREIERERDRVRETETEKRTEGEERKAHIKGTTINYTSSAYQDRSSFSSQRVT